MAESVLARLEPFEVDETDVVGVCLRSPAFTDLEDLEVGERFPSEIAEAASS